MTTHDDKDICAMESAHAESQKRRVVLSCRVNGEAVVEEIDPTMLLLHFLRDKLKLFGAKEACGEGECGACTVILNGQAVNSCLVLAVEARGGDVLTVEGVFFPQPEPNITSLNKSLKGDPKKALEGADLVVENEFTLPAVAHVPLETHVSIVEADPFSNRIRIWSSAQSPFALRQLMAFSFGVQESDIEVHIPFVGGAFGGKAGIYLEPLVTLLSRASGGAPVKLRMTREQEFNYLPARAGMRGRIKTGVKRDGKMVASDIVYDWDSGACADYGVNVGKTAVYGGLGPYDIDHVSIVSNTIYTNKVFSTAYRGFGHLETLWTVERQMDILSQKLGIDPYEFRMKNILRPGATTVTGERMTRSTSCPADCLSAVVREIGWTGRKSEEDREWETGKVRGKGFAMIQKAPAMPPNTATSVIMQMAGDGHVKIMIGAVDIEVDVESGAITVLKVASAFDLGQVINERMVYGQVVGGVMQGIGSAILEGYKFNDDNVLLNPSFTDNKIPTMKDMPLEVVPIYIENPQLNGPYGARGVAEHTMISIPSAIGNALYDALGINFYHLPLTPENVALGIASGKKDIQ